MPIYGLSFKVKEKSMKKERLAIVTILLGSIAGLITLAKHYAKKITQKQDAFQKMNEFYHVLNQWLSLKQEDKCLADYFERNEFKTIAIYGMKELGQRLYDELKNTDIKVRYIIDKNASNICAEVDAVTPDETLEEVDVIVVTAIHYYEEIESMLMNKVDYPVVSIEDVIYETE